MLVNITLLKGLIAELEEMDRKIQLSDQSMFDKGTRHGLVLSRTKLWELINAVQNEEVK